MREFKKTRRKMLRAKKSPNGLRQGRMRMNNQRREARMTLLATVKSPLKKRTLKLLISTKQHNKMKMRAM
jgi:hypothetical protein